MGVSSIASSGFVNYAKRAGRIYSEMLFGTGYEALESSINKSIFGKRPKNAPWYNPYKGSDWSNFGTKMKDAFKALEQHEATVRASNGGSTLKSIWNNFTSIPKAFSEEIKNGSNVAKLANKSTLWGGIKGFGKAFMKKMPLIGGLMSVGFELLNIISAFKEGGLVEGLKEVGRGALQIGADMGGFIVGQALIPIPFVGGIIGSMVLGNLCSAIVGKGYNERKEEELTNGQIPQNGGYEFHVPFTAQADGVNMPSMPNFEIPQATMTPEQIMKLQMALENPNAFVGIG